VSEVIEVMNYLDSLNIASFVTSEENIIYTKKSIFLNQYISILKLDSKPIKVDSYADYFLNNKDVPIKINISGSESQMREVSINVKRLYNLTFTDIGYNMCELVSNDASKGKALEFLCEYFNIEIKETIGIGDSLNDYSLIEAAGLGIAVANATPKLKAIAKLITVDSSQAAVAHVISQVLEDRI
jgi:HAD superfamily hydrolase (TIGR01484 family)